MGYTHRWYITAFQAYRLGKRLLLPALIKPWKCNTYQWMVQPGKR